VLARSAFTVLLAVDVETAWARAQGSGRPLAQDESEFRRLFDERLGIYAAVADGVAHDVDGVVLAAA
jgi:shikimate kinase